MEVENRLDTLRLVRPGMEHLSQIADFRRELLNAGSSMDGCGPLIRMEDPMEWLLDTQARSRLETLPEGRVLSTQLLCMRGDTLVGMIQVRHILNEYLEKYAGHIGYAVRPSERRKGYGAWMLGAVLPVCRDIGLDKIMVACLDTNPASRKIILSWGGVYDRTVHQPEEDVNLEQYWIKL